MDANRFQPIFSMFSQAISNNLKYPKIRLQSKQDTVIVKLAGDKSRYTGQIQVTNDGAFGSSQSKYFGRIDTNGAIYAGRDLTPEIEALLEEFAKDPLGVALRYGTLTGNCMFCGKQLTDVNSAAVGYGSTCAKKYALPWKAASKRKAKPEVEVGTDILWSGKTKEQEDREEAALHAAGMDV